MSEEVLNRPTIKQAKSPGVKIKKDASKLNIILKSYDSKILDQTAHKVKDTLNKMSIDSCGPIPLLSVTKNFVVLKSPHVNKDARQNFRLRIMKRLIQVEESRAVVTALHGMSEVHPSVNIEIKLVEKKSIAGGSK